MDFDKVKEWIFEIIEGGLLIPLYLIDIMVSILFILTGIGIIIFYFCLYYATVTSNNLIVNILGWTGVFITFAIIIVLIISGIYKLITIEVDEGECGHCDGTGLLPENEWIDNGYGPFPSSCNRCNAGRKKKRILK